MKVQTVLAIILFSIALVLGACSDSGSGNENMAGAGLFGQPRPIGSEPADVPDEEPMPDTTTGVAAIAGLWDNSVIPVAGGPIDVLYLEITADGNFNAFDFRGDEVDQGENCHILARGNVVNLGGTLFRATIPAGALQFNAEVTLAGQLFVTRQDGSTVTLPALVGLSAVDFNLC